MKILSAVLVLALSLSISASAQPAESTPDMQEAMKALGMLFGGGAAGGEQAAKPMVHQRQLRALLPESFAGMKRSNTEAGKQAMFGMNISYAQATYAGGTTSIDVKITDISAMGEFMKMAQYAWTNAEMERESDDGYERTTKIAGFPAQESFENNGKNGRIQVMIDGRFIVEIDGSGAEMQTLHDLLKEIDLKKLAALQPEEG
ncbi:MAG TPA: hypothetical protein PKE26_08590 [Kiritimatiellia bacterium]|nr:hypothetical protein [Kiritimatiellia bacterium]HMO99152.1 hypothetical protein [Kiritimatiellia bacterium]HMP95670.1 hypothetical protein [Kiritimatiellia bacterium]